MHGESQQPPKKPKLADKRAPRYARTTVIWKTWLRGEITLLRLNQLCLGWLGVASADPSQLQQPYALQFRRPRPHDGVTQSASNYGTAVTLALAETSFLTADHTWKLHTLHWVMPLRTVESKS